MLVPVLAAISLCWNDLPGPKSATVGYDALAEKCMRTLRSMVSLC
jgi:hypothetical protein